MAEGKPTHAQDMSLLRLANVVLRYRRAIAASTLGLGFMVGIVLLLSYRHYTSSASFTPQSRRLSSAMLAGLASQFGFNLPNNEPSQSPAFYADLLKSREVLEGVVDTRYTFSWKGEGKSGDLVELFDSHGRTAALRREAAIKYLDDVTDVSTSIKTGIVTLEVTTRYPELSRQVAARFLDLLNTFNLKVRQSQASAERQFTEQRVKEIREDLRAAEDREQAFLQRNRDFRNSPELTFQHDRLARDVAMQQQIFTTMMQAYEQAKIDEVRDTPVITVVEQPEPPVRPDPRGTIRKTILGCLLGGVLGVALAFWRDFLKSPELAGQSEFEEFLRLRAEAAADLRHPVQAVRRLRPGTEAVGDGDGR